MSINIIDLIKGQLGSALVSQAASQYGESESGISKAISGLLPAVLGGLANNSSNSSILDAITGSQSGGLLTNLLGGTSGNPLVSTIISSIFGDKASGLINAISSYAGVSNSTSSNLLNMVTGATVGSLGKYAADNNLDRSGVAKLLDDQKGLLSSILPAGLSLASLGLGNWFGGSTADHVKQTVHTEPKVEVNRGANPYSDGPTPDNNNDGGGSVLKWLLPLVLALLAGWFLWKQCDKKKETTTTTTDTTVVTTDTVATTPIDTVTTVTTTKTDTDIDLNGVSLKGYADGMEDKMIKFLKADGYKNAADDASLKSVWYDFDHVNFKMGSNSVLEAGSEGQLENLLTILKAYPDAKIKIGGYTDKTGNEEANKKLSKERAEFIQKWLANKGVGAQVLGAEGYGSEFATLPATASDAERAIDRKMSVRFAK